MVDGQANRQFNKIAEKWRALSEKRRAYFVDLYQSGRWKRYYSEADFVLRMRDATKLVELWARVAPPDPAELPKDAAASAPQEIEAHAAQDRGLTLRLAARSLAPLPGLT